MEASSLDTYAAVPALRGPTTLLRLQSDERLVTLTRRGNQSAYEVLVQRYQSRLLAFCRHMLGSKEDAEDVLQEVFANAFNAMMSDTRPINVRPWLYRIARNRSLNHLRRIQPIGVDTMDDRIADHGTSAADTAHRRAEFRELLGDVRQLAETQRTALLLREIDALSYDQIAEAMDTTVPSVKSLLVRARVSLAEAAEARNLTCEEVRDELGEVAESLKRLSPPIRRHIKECERCAAFQTHLKQNNRAMQAIFPLGPLVVVKKLLAHATAGAGASGGAAVTGVAAGSATGGIVTAGVGAIATKTAAGLAAAALVTAGAVEGDHARTLPRPDAAKERIVASAAYTAPTTPSVSAPTPPATSPTGPTSPSGPIAAVPTRTTTGRTAARTATTTTGSRTKTGTTTTTTATTATTTTAPPTSVPTTSTGTTATTTQPTTTTPPVDTGSQTVTLPSTTSPSQPSTTTTSPSTTSPSTSTSTTPETAAPKATPGGQGQLQTPKLGSSTTPKRTTKRPKGTKRRVTTTGSSASAGTTSYRTTTRRHRAN